MIVKVFKSVNDSYTRSDKVSPATVANAICPHVHSTKECIYK